MAARDERVYALNMGTIWDSQGVNTLADLHRADRSYMRIARETEHDLRTADTIDELLETLTWSTIHTGLFATLFQTLRRVDREYTSEKLDTLLNMLPDGKRAMLKRCMRRKGAEL
jgi:hypothetical protein